MVDKTKHDKAGEIVDKALEVWEQSCRDDPKPITALADVTIVLNNLLGLTIIHREAYVLDLVMQKLRDRKPWLTGNVRPELDGYKLTVDQL